MIHSRESAHGLIIIAEPNRSASWRVNKLVLLAISVLSLGIALGFTLIGAWPILPFAGLELSCLGAALYYANWKQHYRHVIELDEHHVRIDKGHYRPRRSWTMPRAQAALALTPERHPWDGPAIYLTDTEHRIRVGDFLNREDALQLQALLRKNLSVRSFDRMDGRDF